ncbi:MAG: zinc-ribbon domain-containing protein, partial [Myxococcales bacterium]
MRVTCPSCSTAYNVDDKKIPASGATLKCAKCKSSFPVRPGAAAAPPPPPKAVPLPG